MSFYYGFKPYVSVAQRRAQARREMDKLRKKGLEIQPIEIEGRKIAKTFWGESWCKHMDAQGDYANRLPRGRTYVRNGSVCHLEMKKGKVTAIVSGSELYNVDITIKRLADDKWARVKEQSSGQIGSLMELLQGRISKSVMEIVTHSRDGLFPLPGEIRLNCDCPDYATMCKHAAAVLYGVGARLDHQPELLFLLRGVNHLDLVTASADAAVSQATSRGGRRRQVASGDLADVFGIELDEGEASSSPAESSVQSSAATSPKKRASRKAAKKSAATKKPVKKKVAKKRTASTKNASPKHPTATATASKRAAKKKPGVAKKSKKKTTKK